jgi:uncharacterized delta-60 repeat protein
VTTPVGILDSHASSVAIDSQGHIVAGGWSSNGGDNDFAIARYRPDGSLDPSFQGTGKVTTPISAGQDLLQGVVVDSRDRIVAVGQAASATVNDFATVRYVGDQTPPTVTIASGPADGGFTNDTTPSFDFSSSEAGSSFGCGFDAVPPAACGSPFTPGTALADGPHSISITATDRAGNSATAGRSFTIDTVAPGLEINGHRKFKSRKRKARAHFELAANEPVTFSCEVDEMPAGACDADYRTRKLKRGKHTLTVTATDRAGNASSEAKKLKIVRR